jgi:hypothetical protein
MENQIQAVQAVPTSTQGVAKSAQELATIGT